uniref:Triacylglycerol lipase N-terminal domain-containing protein n=1 Tax=Phytophthora fragariae TaxID=53985 RepID=A0A6A3DMR7_9STRA|nr:hypothetical protein PF009_g28237 [Phytophthora fragariae]
MDPEGYVELLANKHRKQMTKLMPNIVSGSSGDMIQACVMRNELGVDSPSLHLECKSGTKTVINEYNGAVVRALGMLGNASEEEFSSAEKIEFFKHVKQSFGSTALCLSGGGSIAMQRTKNNRRAESSSKN